MYSVVHHSFSDKSAGDDEGNMDFNATNYKDNEPMTEYEAGNEEGNEVAFDEADPELEAIRQRRMQELMTQHGAGNQQNPEQQNAQEDAKREADERRQMMLSQILSSQARERHQTIEDFDKVEKPGVFVDDLIDLDLCPPSMVHDDKGDVQENIGDVVGNDAPTIDDVEPEEQADPELEAIRQRRMQELMTQHGAGNQQNPEQQNAQEDAKREADERRQMMLSQICRLKHAKDKHLSLKNGGEVENLKTVKNQEGSKSRKGIECYYHCGKLGHMKKEYRKFKREQKKENGDEKGTIAAASEGDLIIVSDDSYVGLTCYDTNWVIDSGASFLVTPRRDFFTSYTHGDFDQTIEDFDKVEKPGVFVDDLIDLDLCPPSMVHDDKGDVQENIGDVVGNDAPTIDDVEPEEQPEKARGVEDVVLRAAQMGQIVEKVSEERLISLLEQINNQTTKQTKVTIQRRRSVLDDDD
ncbi:hypothetical protein HHK36_001602 [Tetracentron sinense]|uniref:CCHC-type domain-containing protein n=1 Tax=Tetracentron sinense TaxID=13715 RepID=A0A834ZXJ8_TETSI|nr:hypothetical protein HHK36_001602 [Tetracentron sinense]